ncbi:hypothetical protein ACFQ51_40220 [Streptomyces kaempferi]
MNSNNETTTAPPETAGFDVREFARTAHGSHRGTLDLGSLAKEPLDTESVRLVRALRDMERATLHRVRDLLVTATHKDARVTAFLTTWMFERFWIADALDAVLDASPAARDLPSSAGPARWVLSERRERRGPIRRSLIANITGTQIVAEHVTTGLVDEWITQVAYRRLAACPPPWRRSSTLWWRSSIAISASSRRRRSADSSARPAPSASPAVPSGTPLGRSARSTAPGTSAPSSNVMSSATRADEPRRAVSAGWSPRSPASIPVSHPPWNRGSFRDIAQRED